MKNGFYKRKNYRAPAEREKSYVNEWVERERERAVADSLWSHL